MSGAARSRCVPCSARTSGQRYAQLVSGTRISVVECALSVTPVECRALLPVIRAVELADAAAQGGEELVGQRRDVVDHGQEVALGEDQEVAVGLALGAGGAR